jgi:hypothetical protein
MDSERQKIPMWVWLMVFCWWGFLMILSSIALLGQLARLWVRL